MPTVERGAKSCEADTEREIRKRENPFALITRFIIRFRYSPAVGGADENKLRKAK